MEGKLGESKRFKIEAQRLMWVGPGIWMLWLRPEVSFWVVSLIEEMEDSGRE